jgi:DNA-binding CsgD family transcriptional regulator
MHSEFDNLLDHIYEAAVLSDHWTHTLQRIANLANVPHALLASYRDGNFRDWVTTSDFIAQKTLEHAERFPDGIRTTRLLAARHPGFLRDIDVLTSEEIATNPLYTEFLYPNELGAGAATAIHCQTNDLFIVHVERSIQQGILTTNEISLLDNIRPHLARAILLSSHVQIQKAHATTRALEMLGLAAAAIGANGRSIAFNEKFQALIPNIFQDEMARFRMKDARANKLFDDAIISSLDTSNNKIIRSIPVKGIEDIPPMIVHIVPICGAARDLFTSTICIVFVVPIKLKEKRDTSAISDLFDLTPAEARLAALVAGGHTLRESASMLNISEENARTTSKKLFQKMGVNRQAELVKVFNMPFM